MRLSCKQKNLARGLSIVGRAVSSRTTLPVLNNILLATEDGRLRLSATNLEIGINCWINAAIEDEGQITVPARLLQEFTSQLPDDDIVMELNPRTQTLNLKCARFEANIKGLDAEEFPAIPKVSDTPTAVVDPAGLREAIRQVAFAAATDDSRPVLTGVLCRFEGNELTLVAADGYRLAMRRLPLATPVNTASFNGSGSSGRIDVIIPARTLQELGRILTDEGDDDQVAISITPNKSQVLFHSANVDLVSRLIEGNFPNVQQLIPQRYSTRAVLDTQQFLKAIKLASFFARDSNNIVRIAITPAEAEDTAPGRMVITATAAEVGDNVGEVDTTVDGDEAQIAFNVALLQEGLGAIPTGQVSLELNSASNPGVLKPIGSDGYTHIIMPMATPNR